MIKTILYFIIAIPLSACAVQQQTTQSSQPESTSSIKIPKNFYAEELGQCRMNGNFKDYEITAPIYKSEIKPIIGFDWQNHHTKYSTSMRVEHQPFSRPIAYLSAAIHHAAFTKDEKEIQITTDFIYQIAKGNQFMNTKSYDEAKGLCYGENNNTSAPCPIHAPSFVGTNMTTYLISALWLKEYFTKEQMDVLNPYINKIYFKYIHPKAIEQVDSGFYDMANLGIGRLAYAAWTNDTKMAEDEFRMRLKQMDKLWEENGYIDNNSYRGVRGVFYHSSGVDIALGYIQLANAWGYKVPDMLMVKVKKSAELINAYIDDPKNYYNYPDSKIPFNASKNPADAQGVHSQAFALKTLMKNVVDVDLKPDREFENKSRGEFIDVMLGFNPKCMFPN